MKVVIEDKYLGELVDTGKTSGKPKFPVEIEKKFKMRISQLIQVKNTADLRQLKALHFEKLKRAENEYSIRVNDTWRIIFRIENDELVEVLYVEELSNHYG